MRRTWASSTRRLTQFAVRRRSGAIPHRACCSTGNTTAASPIRSADRRGLGPLHCGGGLFHAEQEVRRDQHLLDGQAQAFLERIAVLLHHRDQLDQPIDFVRRSRGGGKRGGQDWPRSCGPTAHPELAMGHGRQRSCCSDSDAGPAPADRDRRRPDTSGKRRRSPWRCRPWSLAGFGPL